MIDARIKLTILEDNASTFTDHSNNLVDYQRDTVTLAMANTDHLYVGFPKQVTALYAELKTVDVLDSTLTIEIWDGSAWTVVEHQDESRGLSRSGFITWVKQTEPVTNSVDGKELVWARLSYDNGNAAELEGLNLVFADDQSLKTEFANINDPRILGAGKTSHIVQHVAARNLMVQELRNEGYIKQKDGADLPENITQWDLLDIYEIRQAAIYLTLSKIFFVLSDEVDDNWWTKHIEYHRLYTKTFQTAKLSVDTDDDGVEDINEKLAPRKSMRFSR